MWINEGSLQGLEPRIAAILTLYFELLAESSAGEDGEPGILQGFYLYGSVALGDYSLALSDIDFVAVTKEKLGDADILRLGGVHRTVQSWYPKPNMDGIYVTADQLGKLPHETDAYPFFHDGSMAAAGYFECNPVTWHELKTCGIAIVGGGTSTLPYETDIGRLLGPMYENLNGYWRSWIDRSSEPFSAKGVALLGRDAASWGVLGIARLYYTFRERAIATKAGAGEYMLRQPLGDPWRAILTESIRYRRGESSLYRSPWARRKDALACMEAIYQACEAERPKA
jgi:hypothetical protein